MPGIGMFGADGAPMSPGGMASAMGDPIFMIDRPQSNVPVAPRPRTNFAPVDNGGAGMLPQMQIDPQVAAQMEQARQMAAAAQAFMAERGIDMNSSAFDQYRQPPMPVQKLPYYGM